MSEETTLLQHDESRVLNKVDQSPDQDAPFTTTSWQVAEAVKHGYILPDFNLIDYIRTTWQGLSTDDPNPLHPDKPRTRFHLVNIWGEQGSAKTSFASQILGLAYGAYDQGKTTEEKREVWEFCQKMAVVNRHDLRTVAQLVSQPNQRLKVVLLDDLNSIIPRQLAWEDRELYRKTFELLGMIRRKTGTILTTEPNIEMVIEAFKEVMTFEVIVYPNATYKVERMCHDIHPHFRATDKLTKIIVEDPDHGAHFNPYHTPSWWWDEYQKRTNEQGQEAFNKVIDRMAKLEEEVAKGKSEDDKKKMSTMIRTGMAARDIIEIARKVGLKGDTGKIQDFTKELKIYQLKRIGEEPTEETG